MSAFSQSCQVILGNPELADRTIQETIERFQIQDVDRVVLYADAVDVSRLIQELEYFPLLSPKRLVIVRNIEAIKKSEWAGLLDYLSKSFEHLQVIMIGTAASIRLNQFFISLEEYKEKTPEVALFQAVYSGRRLTSSEALRLFQACLEKKGESFPLLISAVEIHLRKKYLSQPSDIQLLHRQWFRLHQLDLSLKTGRLTPEAGLEIFLAYLLG
ncbi:MAG: hypothetical protein NC911_01995 [Candidatus Omnitrophica bacterium]|nr:hypothetical protein [Candidatus Omnitrophota bacterium]